MTDKKRMKKMIDVLITSNQWKFVKIFYLLIKFSKIMISRISSRNFSKLTHNHFRIIGDKAHYFDDDKNWINLISNF